MIVSAIAAVSDNGIIGRKGALPWHLPDDLRFFQRTTSGHPVIMGRRNWDSIPAGLRPLKGRPNIVITRQSGFTAEGARVVGSIDEALKAARSTGTDEAFVIGGAEIYREAFYRGLVDRAYITRVHAQVEGDVRMPEMDGSWREAWSERHEADARHAHAFTFKRLERIR